MLAFLVVHKYFQFISYFTSLCVFVHGVEMLLLPLLIDFIVVVVVFISELVYFCLYLFLWSVTDVEILFVSLNCHQFPYLTMYVFGTASRISQDNSGHSLFVGKKKTTGTTSTWSHDENSKYFVSFSDTLKINILFTNIFSYL